MKIFSEPFPPYPRELEEWWQKRALLETKQTDLPTALTHLRPDVQRLSDVFTFERATKLADYSQDARLLLAYGLFFFPQTYARISLVLAELAKKWKPPGEEKLRLLDIGSGLGAATLATAFSPVLQKGGSITALDHSPSSLRILQELFTTHQNLWPQSELRTQWYDARRPLPKKIGDFHLILSCFALNEICGTDDESISHWLRNTLSLLVEGGALILCEPATQECSVRLQKLREIALTKNLAVPLAPCLHHESCPMLQYEDIWCHQVRRWYPPQSAEFLNRRLHRNLTDLKFSYLLLQAGGKPKTFEPSPALARLTAPLYEVKGRVLTSGCASDGLLHAYELQTRDIEKKNLKRLMQLERGDILEWTDPRALPDGKTIRVSEPNRALFSFER